MIESLEFLSLDEALEFVPCRPTVAISILSPGRCAAALHPAIDDILRLYFHDGVARADRHPGTVLFCAEQAQSVVDFLRRHHTRAPAQHLLIHCEAGISRSAAVAVFAASECRVALRGQFAFLNPWVLTTLVRSAYPHYAFD
ncbi:MAG: hypothetical protein H6Q35_2487 [Proteobacteria bacterium]|nr:hypothetical protein [Pseudomonadota bacterium]MBS1229264.1 hypothetical protein [Pseudomonadota bacterium]